MKHTQKAAALLLLAAGFVVGVGVARYHQVPAALPATPITDPDNPDIQTLVRLQTRLAASFAPLDSGAIASLLAPDMRAINAADQVVDRATALSILRSAQGALVRVVDDSIQVRLYGPVAIMTLRESVTLRAGAGESTGQLRMTEVWFKRAGQWGAIGSQATVLP